MPRGREITVNLAPADIRKEGTAYDLPHRLGHAGRQEQLDAARLETHL
jgi:magnesium chelatase family protein